MGSSQQLFLAFCANTLKGVLGYSVPADCPGTTYNQEPAAAGKGAHKGNK
jgi:hypothetical protein